MKDEDKEHMISMTDHMSIVKHIMSKREPSYAEGGEIMDSDHEAQEKLSMEDSAHMSDDLASHDSEMNENMGTPDEDPKARRRKMILAGIGR